VPTDTEVSADIGKMELPGGMYAVGHFEILPHEYQDAWDSMCGSWLPGSGYQPDDRLPFEQCLNNPEEHPEGKHIVHICIPVKPL
jgi:AraC family transcriptional regulator